MEITPDRQVQESVRGIFQKFRELGSIRQVLLWYRNEKLMIPTLGKQAGCRKVVWTLPVYPSLLLMLKMYGPPSNCKRFEVGRKDSPRKCIRPLSGESLSGHLMMIRTCRSF
jgi:hypothetical protein